jgi:hypothetical protein
MKKYKPYLTRVDLVKNQVERERIQEQEAAKKRKQRIQEQNRQNHLRYQEQLRSELAARYFHSVISAGGESFTNTYSVAFDGTDDHIDLGSGSTVADGGQFSFSFWIKGGSQSSNRYLFSADYYNQHTFWVVSGTSFQWMNLNAVKSNLSIDVLDNNWHHILVIWNPDGANQTIRCFTDGANEVNVSTDWRFGTGGIYKGALQYIGNRGGGSYNGFIGNLDEFAIWDDDQSANVSAIYNSGQVHDLNALSSPPVNWYRMGDGNGGTGSTVTDQGTGGINGTLTNDATFEEDIPS